MQSLPRIAPRYWTPEEEDYLRKFFQSQTSKEIGKALNRTYGSVAYHASHMGLKRDIEWTPKRFFAAVIKQENGCWIWPRTPTERGYGRLKINGKHFGAHRYALEITIGRDLLPGEQACHKCDVRNCVNPDHLFVGTQKDNIADAMSKGRMALQAADCPWRHPFPQGERHFLSKLDPDKIREIRRLRTQGLSQQKIANRFCVSQPTISCILLGETWTHVE